MTRPVQTSLPFAAPAAEPPARRNLIIEAGAGTGKTTAIVGHVLELLLSRDDVAPERVVLMTFTEKAAGEIADRIQQALADIEAQFAAGGPVAWPAGSPTALFTVPPGEEERYRRAARTQLENIERLRSQTIHSFCQSLLRAFPIEAGLDPQFKIVEGFERSLLYNQLYDTWADGETRLAADRAILRQWEVLLASAGWLGRIRELVFALVNRRDLLQEELPTGDLADVAPAVQRAVQDIRTADPGNLEDHDALRLVEYLRRGELPEPSIDGWIAWFEPVAPHIRNADLPAGKAQAALKNAMKVLRGSNQKGDSIYDHLVRHRAALALLDLTRRFIRFLDDEKHARGVADFDDLLLRTRDLLEDPALAERIRQQFDFVFVDEFQDTDRVQARIIERIATDKRGNWVPGRLVIVGDPKQSIYAFRRADPETYRRVSTKMLDAGAARESLEFNYRSDPPLLEAFNTVFDSVFAAGGDDANVFRPAYRPLRAGRKSSSRELDARFTFLHAGVGEDGERHVAEAEAIAAWIEAHRDGGEKDLQRFAILFRRLTKIDDYLEAFDRYGIDYVLPPTRAFLDRRAPVDLLAVLRAVAFPLDKGAQISAARSPWFALTDEEIADGVLAGSEAWRQFTEAMDAYRAQADCLSVSAVIDLLVETTAMEQISAATIDGRRSLRHLEHLRALAFEFDDKSGGSLRQFVTEIDRRREEPDESDPSLADDDSNAVRILTVHAAKGLEFETVIVPDLMSTGGRDAPQIYTVEEPPALVLTGAVETLSAEFLYASGLPLRKVAGEREDAEMRRLFYVAATRAKSDVVFVCPPEAYRNSGFFRCLIEAFGFDKDGFPTLWPDQGRALQNLRGVNVAFERAAGREAPSPAARRKLRDAALEDALLEGPLQPLAVDVPPVVVKPLTPAAAAAGQAATRSLAAGTLLHRFLERWDGAADPAPLLSLLASESAVDDRTAAAVSRRVATLRSSPNFRTLQEAETVGRELSLRFIDAAGNAVERRLDRLLRLDTEVVLDYKSGQPTPERLARDREQVGNYCRAVEGMTGRPCRGLIWYVDDEQDEMIRV